jgi:hypothetical protein
MNSIVSTKFQVSKTILQKDYYRKVLGEWNVWDSLQT